MSHDKIKAAARKRMAQAGEPYTAARREVIKNYQQAGAAASSSSAVVRYQLQRYGPGLPTGEQAALGAGAWSSTPPCCGYEWLGAIKPGHWRAISPGVTRSMTVTRGASDALVRAVRGAPSWIPKLIVGTGA
jgi:hypothetical protein